MSKQEGRRTGQRFVRGDVVARNAQHRKPAEPAACPRCGASVKGGRWTWEAAPEDASETLCPACVRISDNDPAAVVILSGTFTSEHGEEIVHLIRNVEEKEASEHPLNRLVSIRRKPGSIVVKTTEVRLARTIGEALKRAYEGDLDYHFVESDNLFRVTWKR